MTSPSTPNSFPDTVIGEAASTAVITLVPLSTGRRLLEISRRNELRREAKLPLPPIAKKLRRMKEQEELEAFSRFEAANGRAVWDQVLKERRGSGG